MSKSNAIQLGMGIGVIELGIGIGVATIAASLLAFNRLFKKK